MDHYYIYHLVSGSAYYFYGTAGTEQAARDRVRELERYGHAIFLKNHLIRGAFY